MSIVEDYFNEAGLTLNQISEDVFCGDRVVTLDFDEGTVRMLKTEILSSKKFAKQVFEHTSRSLRRLDNHSQGKLAQELMEMAK